MDILEAYKYCPICGKHGLKKVSAGKMQCEACGYGIYLNPTIGAVGVIMDKAGRLLVVRRSKDPAQGTLHLPGGFVEVGETLEQAIVREVKEELNIEVNVEEYLFSFPDLYEYKGIERYPLDFFFKCSIKDMSSIDVDLTENREYKFLSPQEIKIEDFGLPSIRECLRRYFKK